MEQTLINDNEEIIATRGEQIREAVSRMNLIGFPEHIIQEFKKTGKVYFFAGPDGAPMKLPLRLKEAIKKAEDDYGVVTFAVIHKVTSYGVLDSLIVVGKYMEDWENDKENLATSPGYALTYTINWTYPECSELGDICFSKTQNGLIRVG